jgi:hypothetical protein
MSTHVLRLNVALLMIVLMATVVGGWVSLASAGAKEVKPKAPVPETGQTLSSADGDDGDLQAGVTGQSRALRIAAMARCGTT